MTNHRLKMFNMKHNDFVFNSCNIINTVIMIQELKTFSHQRIIKDDRNIRYSKLQISTANNKYRQRARS